MDQYIGKMLDNRYEILDIIGLGGMAVVYKAYCHRLHRFVAIKVLKRDLASDAEFRRRFHEEAQAVAMLSHPNIVSVYDVSKGDDLDYIVMELIDGITLKQYMQQKNGSLNWRESLYFITQIMRALSHAHSRGIIHRDIKPQNILVLRDGSVRVTDFGIARIMSAAQKTMTQEALGSVHYIAPEQARGSHIDARADIYSAGVVLYEMLTGRLPFDGETPVSVAIQHINAVPLTPRELSPDIPPGLEEITMKAMASRIDQRYLNAEAMLADLEEFRKNPQVTFGYDLASFHGSQPVPEEGNAPSEPPLGDTPTRRKRPPNRTRTDPPPRRTRPPEVIEEEEEDPEDRRRRIIIPVAIVIFLVGVGIFLWITFFSGFFSRPEMIDVPYLVGRSLTEVCEDKDVTDHFAVKRSSIEYSDEYAEGEIIEQDLEAGTEAEDGSTIYVVVSGGVKPVIMIDVQNFDYETAVSRLLDLGLNVDSPEYQASDTIDKDKVISYSPAKGTQLTPGDTVHLVVSTGPEIKKVTVPTVTGQSLDQARSMLTELGLDVGNVTNVDSDQPQGEVVYQSIAAGTSVEVGTAIILHVSNGPAVAQPVSKEVTVAGLPTDRETVEVTITVGEQEVYRNQVNTAAGGFTTTVTGTGVQEICIYMDGELVSRYSVNFDQ